MDDNGDTSQSEARVAELWHYPVKSMQGIRVHKLAGSVAGFTLDREWALIDSATGHVLSAKTVPLLLAAKVTTDPAGNGLTITLPDGTDHRPTDADIDDVLSAWLGRAVVLRHRRAHSGGGYDMTFDPPDDSAEQYEIPVEAGTFFDLATVHLITTATLEHAKVSAPQLDWDVRRFRPNLVIETNEEPFVEDRWAGRSITIGSVSIAIEQPTVRCAMPLRAQPGLARSLETYHALQAVHANHLGVYGSIVEPGTITTGEEVRLA